MEESLAEREQCCKQEKQQPLINLSEGRLRERFKGSLVLEQVGRHVCRLHTQLVRMRRSRLG